MKSYGIAMGWLFGMLLAITVFSFPVAHAETLPRFMMSRQTTVIQQGQAIENVLILGHNVTVKGSVTQLLVAVDGNVHLTTSSVSGIVVDLGGQIQQDRGARVDSIYQMALHTPFWNGALFGGLSMMGMWAGMLVVEISLIVLSLLIHYALRHQMEAMLQPIESSVRRVGLMGVLITVAALAIGMLGAVTVIGLPITFLVFILYLIAGVVGFSIVSYWLGKLSLRHSPKAWPTWQTTFIGSGLIAAMASIPYLGLLLFLIFWLVGVGAITLWGSEAWKTRRSGAMRQHSSP